MHCIGCGRKLKVVADRLAGIDRAACDPCALNFEILPCPEDGSSSIQVVPYDNEDEDESENDPDD